MPFMLLLWLLSMFPTPSRIRSRVLLDHLELYIISRDVSVNQSETTKRKRCL